MKVAFCFPGQGSQELGMGRELAEALPESRAVYELATEAAGFDVAAVCFEGPIETLTRTDVQQPALVTTELACLAALDAVGIRPDVVIGHSVGEYGALAAAGILTPASAIRLVAARGRATATIAEERPGAMAALIGLGDEAVEGLCAAVGEVWPANYNCPGQVVVSGAADAVDALLERAEAAGARRAVKLRVTGAFHSPLVAAAGDLLRPAIAETVFSPETTPFMSTVSSQLEPPDRVPELLVEQLSAPVRFTQAIASLVERGVETFVEVGPGQVLAGLIKRIDRSVRTASVGDRASLAQAEAMLSRAVS